MVRPALHGALALCVVLAGCSALAPAPTRQDRAVAAHQNATDAVGDVDTYRFESTLRVDASGNGRSESVTVDASGAVAVDARRMQTTAERDGETRTSYLDNRTRFVECPDPWDGWGRERVDGEDDWSRQTPLVRHLSLLGSGSLYWNGTTTLDGERVALVTGEPSKKALRRYRDDGRGPTLGGPSVENPEVSAWLDLETSRPRKVAVSFEVTNGDATADARLVSRFVDYGDPVDVSVPAEARADPYELGCPGD